MLILCYFEYTTASSKKISGNQTALNCSFGFKIANTIKAVNIMQFH